MVTDPREALLKALEDNRQKDEAAAEEAKKQKEEKEREKARREGVPAEWSRFLSRLQLAATKVNNDIADQGFLYEAANGGEQKGTFRTASVLLLRNRSATTVSLVLTADSDGMVAPKFKGTRVDELGKKRDLFEFSEDDAYRLLVNLFAHYVKERDQKPEPAKRIIV